MDATQETIHQKIFSFVDDVDPDGERTLGVMTKCDLVPTADKDVDAYESVGLSPPKQSSTANITRQSKERKIKSEC
jgi:hypothetical protein